jgi:hypothetical protein
MASQQIERRRAPVRLEQALACAPASPAVAAAVA